jgi:hypothetical protein
MNNRFSLVAACMLLLSFLVVCQGGSLRKSFYQHSCPQADDIIKTKTLQHVSADPNLPAKLLRMHFHDCFVRVWINTPKLLCFRFYEYLCVIFWVAFQFSTWKNANCHSTCSWVILHNNMCNMIANINISGMWWLNFVELYCQ